MQDNLFAQLQDIWSDKLKLPWFRSRNCNKLNIFEVVSLLLIICLNIQKTKIGITDTYSYRRESNPIPFTVLKATESNVIPTSRNGSWSYSSACPISAALEREIWRGIPKHTFLFFSFHLEKKDEPVHKLLPVHPEALPMGFCNELSAYRETLRKAFNRFLQEELSSSSENRWKEKKNTFPSLAPALASYN